jgi:ATP-dependent DNA helicase RecG
MEKAQLLPPTFESDHGNNQFTIRLLLHHFLNEEDIDWLNKFDGLSLNEDQKRALVFVREVGAIDNGANRQLNGIDAIRASGDLRDLREKEVLEQKGKGRYTYYVPGTYFVSTLSAPVSELSAPVSELSAPVSELSTPVEELSTPPQVLSTPPRHSLPETLVEKIKELGKRVNEENTLREVIKEICSVNHFKSSEIAQILDKREDYIKRKYLSKMIRSGDLEYLYPDMPNHPDQAYKTRNSEPSPR